jgi:hypothetical protein
MEMTTAYRAPAQFSAGWRLQRQRDNEFGYRNTPIERGDAVETSMTLPDELKDRLRTVNIRCIDPVELSELAGDLHRSGYLSHDAWEQLGEFQIDYKGPVDPLVETQDALRSIRGVDDRMYALCISLYEAAIDAVTGIEELVDYLNGRIVDVYA